jgi:hypothetical protein
MRKGVALASSGALNLARVEEDLLDDHPYSINLSSDQAGSGRLLK